MRILLSLEDLPIRYGFQQPFWTYCPGGLPGLVRHLVDYYCYVGPEGRQPTFGHYIVDLYASNVEGIGDDLEFMDQENDSNIEVIRCIDDLLYQSELLADDIVALICTYVPRFTFKMVRQMVMVSPGNLILELHHGD